MMQNTEEIWKPIEGFEGFYEVSNYGRVKSLDRYVKWKNSKRLCKGGIMKRWKNEDGYFRVHFSKENKTTLPYVDRLVATAFIPNPDNKPCVDHINTIRTDNRVCNLRWVTSKENSENPLTKKKWENSVIGNQFHIKPIIQYDAKTNEVIAYWNSAVDCYTATGISIKVISKNLRGKSKIASKQYYFQYV